MKILSRLISRRKLNTQRNFFDLKASEKKKIIKKASKEAIKKQRNLMEEYRLLYCSNT